MVGIAFRQIIAMAALFAGQNNESHIPVSAAARREYAPVPGFPFGFPATTLLLGKYVRRYDLGDELA